jgi:hypothetical protein
MIGNIAHFLCLSPINFDSGKITKTVFAGDQEITDATSFLKSSIELYNRAIGSVHFRIGIKTYELVKG